MNTKTLTHPGAASERVAYLLNKEWITRQELEELSKLVGAPVTLNYLNKLATVGGGPEFYRLGRYAVYKPETAIHWLRSRAKGPFKNTSQEAAGA